MFFPNELICIISEFMKNEDRLRLMHTCKMWYDITMFEFYYDESNTISRNFLLYKNPEYNKFITTVMEKYEDFIPKFKKFNITILAVYNIFRILKVKNIYYIIDHLYYCLKSQDDYHTIYRIINYILEKFESEYFIHFVKKYKDLFDKIISIKHTDIIGRLCALRMHSETIIYLVDNGYNLDDYANSERLPSEIVYIHQNKKTVNYVRKKLNISLGPVF